MARSPARTALTLAVLLASAPLALAEAQEQRIERGSAIGTPLPVGKVEPAPIAPPPYSDAEKAALAKIDAEAAALGGLHTTLARQIHGLASLASWLFALAVLQLVVLGVQLLALRRMRRSAAQAPKAEASAAPAKGA